MADEWVVIDFETASLRGTPCQLGAVRYCDAVEVDSLETLIFQPPESFDWFNIALHGITPEAVAYAPRWPDARGQLLTFAGDAPLVAHNAPFDIGVIRDASDLWDLEWPAIRYACSLVLARQIWPGQRSYSLLLLCASLGIPFDEDLAHEALVDARLAGSILRTALAATSTTTLAGLLEHAGVLFGRIERDGWWGSHARALAASSLKAGFLRPNLDADQDSPFYGKNVAFTGQLAMGVRREAMAHVAAAGGTPQDRVTRATDFLVCGFQDIYKLAAGETKSRKLRYAEELHAAGQSIEILSGRDFFRMLNETESARQPPTLEESPTTNS